jgi:3-hydroxyisobutyrate dehydrogenase-like beta-hydroxyacid dehydrogenase
MAIRASLKIALIGFGEAGCAFLDGWGQDVAVRVRAYDIKIDRPDTLAEMQARYEAKRVVGCRSAAEALAEADAVFSLVTADQALAAAEADAPHLRRDTFWFDCNSCAPDTKKAAAAVIERAGGRYVDVAVMAPVHPRRHRTPLFISGPAAEAGVEILESLDMRPRVMGQKVGDASAIKMLRSVMVKGMEALSAECFLAARKAGVDEAVLASLTDSDPELHWARRGAYNLERMMAHGARRAAEMREVAATLRALGLPDRMSSATAVWQDQIAGLGLDAGPAELGERADRILSKL